MYSTLIPLEIVHVFRVRRVRIFAHGGHFSWQGKPCVLVLQSRLFVTAQGIGAVLFRNADCVAGTALWTWW